MTLESGKFSLFPSWIENPIWRGSSKHMCVLGDFPFFIILLGPWEDPTLVNHLKPELSRPGGTIV